jgi:hypothetical protein
MPILSFPCVVTHFKAGKEISRRRTWIKGHDLRALAAAAAKQIDAAAEHCEYALFSPDTTPPAGPAGVFLDVGHGDASALVGPMSGPTPPSTISRDACYRLDDLLTHLGLDDDGDADTRADSGHRHGHSRYVVIVTYAGLWHHVASPPARRDGESDAQYKARCEPDDRMRIDRARHQGLHIVHYDVPPAEWKAHDLEMLMGLAYQLLPTGEPRWRESGAITQAKFAGAHNSREPTRAYCLQIARGDYVAHLRLPTFPTLALAEWLADRRCDISLCHPVMKLELIARGWRCATRCNTTSSVPPPAAAPDPRVSSPRR